MVFSHGQHQGRLLKFGLHGIDVCPAIQQKFEGFRHTGTRCGHQRCFACRIGRVRIGAGIQDETDHPSVSIHASEIQGCDSISIRGLRIGPSVNELLGLCKIVGPHGPMQRCQVILCKRKCTDKDHRDGSAADRSQEHAPTLLFGHA